jgi:hypothetical protein
MTLRVVVVVALLAAVIAVLGVGLRQSHVPTAAAAPSRYLCGSERWSVKTFSDGDRLKVRLKPKLRTVKQLNAVARPAVRPSNGRAAVELNVYRIHATVDYVANEDDGDVHLGLIGPDGSKLIAEAPEPACALEVRDRGAINRARLVAQDVQPGDKVIATGLAFFDFKHGQIDHAGNFIELHPLIGLRRSN